MGVATTLSEIDDADLTPVEWRTLLWSRCSLAALYGIRADEALADIPGDLSLLIVDERSG